MAQKKKRKSQKSSKKVTYKKKTTVQKKKTNTNYSKKKNTSSKRKTTPTSKRKVQKTPANTVTKPKVTKMPLKEKQAIIAKDEPQIKPIIESYPTQVKEKVPVSKQVIKEPEKEITIPEKTKPHKHLKKSVLKKFYIFLLLIFLGLIGFSSYKIFTWYIDNQNIKNLSKEIENNTNINEIPSTDKTVLVNPPQGEKVDQYWEYIKTPFINVDFTNLINKNKDTVGWIHVNGTNINYPVVQTKDNDYYLHHAFDNTYNSAGWVFADYRTTLSFLADNTIIYGHGRYDNTVFGSLRNILNNSWQNNKDNHIVRISTPTTNTLWQVFSIYTIEAESYYLQDNFTNDTAYQDFLNTLKNRSIYDFQTTIDSNDKILTLSTCKDTGSIRVVLHAKLIKEEIR